MSEMESYSPGVNSTVKSGFLRRYKKGFLIFGKGWKTAHVVLCRDSMLMYYSEQGDSSPDGCIELKRVRNFIAVGQYTRSIPNRPDLPADSTEKHIIALPTTPSREADIVWLLCQDDEDLNSWMKAICSTLPPPPQQTGPPATAPSAESENPPPYASKDPNHPHVGPGTAATGQPLPPGSQPQQAGNNTTVVVQGAAGGGGGGGDLATGMLVGGVMGMGMGMALAPTFGVGVGWGNTTEINNVTEINNTTVENNYTSEQNVDVSQTTVENTDVNYADQGFQGAAYGDPAAFGGQADYGFGQGSVDQGVYGQSDMNEYYQGGFDDGGGLDYGGDFGGGFDF